jgi:hypothetical protein
VRVNICQHQEITLYKAGAKNNYAKKKSVRQPPSHPDKAWTQQERSSTAVGWLLEAGLHHPKV